MDRVDDVVSVDGRDEVNSVDDGVADVTLGAVGAVGLAAALIALRKDVRVFRLEGITNQHEYLKYTNSNKSKNTKVKLQKVIKRRSEFVGKKLN